MGDQLHYKKPAGMSVETSQQLAYYPHNAWKEVLHSCQANTSIDMQYVKPARETTAFLHFQPRK
jgi:hypothetical protein